MKVEQVADQTGLPSQPHRGQQVVAGGPDVTLGHVQDRQVGQGGDGAARVAGAPEQGERLLVEVAGGLRAAQALRDGGHGADVGRLARQRAGPLIQVEGPAQPSHAGHRITVVGEQAADVVSGDCGADQVAFALQHRRGQPGVAFGQEDIVAQFVHQAQRDQGMPEHGAVAGPPGPAQRRAGGGPGLGQAVTVLEDDCQVDLGPRGPGQVAVEKRQGLEVVLGRSLEIAAVTAYQAAGVETLTEHRPGDRVVPVRPRPPYQSGQVFLGETSEPRWCRARARRWPTAIRRASLSPLSRAALPARA